MMAHVWPRMSAMYQIKLMRLNDGEVLIEEITSEDLGGRMIIDFFERLPSVFLPVYGHSIGHVVCQLG